MTKTWPDSLIVDEDDNPIGQMQLPQAMREGQILRVVYIFVYSPERDEFLLQRRGPKVLAPLLWSQSAAGHVDWNDTYESAARHELLEETGIEEAQFEEIDYRFETTFAGAQRWVKTYLVRYDGETGEYDTDEVDQLGWFTRSELDQWLMTSPEDFTEMFGRSYDDVKRAL